ncbi:ATP-binding protein [Roseomonas xinghualingensis]|uniref:ATP-binding protein n=1 Tax=Roseomonas xinghualingensis TaxID=2986475 RepID=UPI0021F1C5A8|nr:ATP-binding protein [Roseomonas sp. SXEYE001]MCV4206685.1 ATP-binding protein [Roseomonas sp. SXEYE001]
MKALLRRVLPASLAARTALFLVLALMAVQAAGLTIHALDRVDLQRAATEREMSARTFALWRAMSVTSPERRSSILAELELPSGLEASVDDEPAVRMGMLPAPPPVLRMIRPEILLGGPPRLRPREIQAGMRFTTLYVSMRLPEGTQWLNLQIHIPPMRPWHSETFLAAFVLMTAMAALLIIWATRRLTRPVSDLAKAANALGRDVNAPPLPEDGPREVATAARAFNTMAERIRRFVGDRTQMLAAIGHDLRTPITRLKLRAEFMEDDEQRAKMLADLEEMEAMVTATLAFARDDAAAEPSVPLDLAALCRTVLDEAADARPDAAPEAFSYQGPERLTVRGRPIALKRALANLVANAANYGSAARVTLLQPQVGQIQLRIDDDGPGIPDDSHDAVFQPFRRLEGSRNRETGGVGLGLPIARNILRAHGGDVTLQNRPGGGLTAVVTLPA